MPISVERIRDTNIPAAGAAPAAPVAAAGAATAPPAGTEANLERPAERETEEKRRKVLVIPQDRYYESIPVPVCGLYLRS